MNVGAVVHGILALVWMAFVMFWEILWPLVLGFTISGIIQAVVPKRRMATLMGDDSPRSLAIAAGLGAASSSCSYAAVAIARAVFRKGANFTTAMAFEIASTNLVLEIGIILVVILGWQFALAEFVGGPLMIVIVALLFRWLLSKKLVSAARTQADANIAGRMEGHAGMHMEVTRGTLWERIRSPEGFTAISHYFVMDWMSIWTDLALGLLIAAAVTMWVPATAWHGLFLASHPAVAKWWGPLIGPVIAILAFVCSVGNVPVAAALWNGGMSFGGVVAFIFADLIILPLLNIYRKYYGWRMMLFILATFYAAMVGAALVVELVFGAVHLVPTTRAAHVLSSHLSLNYTTVLDAIFVALGGILVARFFKTDGLKMLRMMNAAPGAHSGHGGHH